jgi:iron complex outermembrane recepter protein
MKTWLIASALLAAPTLAHAQDSTAAAPETLAKVVTLPPIEVSTARAGEFAPVAKTLLDRGQVQSLNWGQDTPMALATLPGAYAYSDAGNGIGYSYLTIRGFPQRRISVLINGVPLNDPESHEVYWIDHPDLLSSTQDVQLQRGIGSALYGAASVGGSVAIDTAPFEWRLPRLSASFSYGSFDTRRVVLEAGSGPLPRGWNLYGRYSRIETDGYRDLSWTKLWSYALSAQRQAGRHQITLNLYGGPERTHLAYLGIPRTDLEGGVTGDADRDRRLNPITYPGEADHFFEPHYELIHSWRPQKHLAATQTLFYFDGDGFYDEQRSFQPLANYRLTPWTTTDPGLFGADSLAHYSSDGVNITRDAQGRVTVENADLVRRRWVGNRHFGWIPRIRIGDPLQSLTVGGELRWHDGHHIGTVIGGNGLPPGTEPDHAYYDYHPRTFSAGLFARKDWRPVGPLTLTADIAWRHQDYFMRGDHFDGVRFDQDYDFGLPRVGLAWWNGGGWRFFGSFAHARREPSFRDLYDAEGAGSVPLYQDGKALIRPERVNDFEAAARWQYRARSVQLNAFRMDFRDELVYAGQFNTDLGYPILGNAARSVHQGIEVEGSWAFGAQPWSPLQGTPFDHLRDRLPPRKWEFAANATLSDNHFVRYREIYGTSPGDTVVYDGKAIGFFPAVMGNLSARFGTRGLTLGTDLQIVGRQYLDQTESKEGSIAPHAVLNFLAGYRRALQQLDLDVAGDVPASVELSVRLFNALDRRYETGGYSYLYGGVRYTDFIPAATRNVLAQVRLDF